MSMIKGILTKVFWAVVTVFCILGMLTFIVDVVKADSRAMWQIDVRDRMESRHTLVAEYVRDLHYGPYGMVRAWWTKNPSVPSCADYAVEILTMPDIAFSSGAEVDDLCVATAMGVQDIANLQLVRAHKMYGGPGVVAGRIIAVEAYGEEIRGYWWDINGNRMIDVEEAFTALYSYYRDELSRHEVVNVLYCYYGDVECFGKLPLSQDG